MDDFNFYNSENDGYRGGFGDYVDPAPPDSRSTATPADGPRKKRAGLRGSRLWSWPAPWWAAAPAWGAPPSTRTSPSPTR